MHESPQSGDFGYLPALLAKGMLKAGRAFPVRIQIQRTISAYFPVPSRMSEPGTTDNDGAGLSAAEQSGQFHAHWLDQEYLDCYRLAEQAVSFAALDTGNAVVIKS